MKLGITVANVIYNNYDAYLSILDHHKKWESKSNTKLRNNTIVQTKRSYPDKAICSFKYHLGYNLLSLVSNLSHFTK